MDFIAMLMNLVIFAAPFIILYFVIAAAVKKGIDSSETGRRLLDIQEEKIAKKK